jgi:hypothetical protein
MLSKVWATSYGSIQSQAIFVYLIIFHGGLSRPLIEKQFFRIYILRSLKRRLKENPDLGTIKFGSISSHPPARAGMPSTCCTRERERETLDGKLVVLADGWGDTLYQQKKIGSAL